LPADVESQFANLIDEPVSLCQFGGEVAMIVNTASECGDTPQYFLQATCEAAADLAKWHRASLEGLRF
jgi:glutathione peroxidase-family protein